MMRDVSGFGGHRKIYEDLVKRLANADIATLARHLNLPINTSGEVEVPFLGATYLISITGVRRFDRRRCSDATASALIHYVLTGCSGRPANIFVPLAELAGPLFKKSSFSKSALEGPIIMRFQCCIPELLSIAASIGGRQGGISGFGSVSLIFEVLPNILLQLIFYDKVCSINTIYFWPKPEYTAQKIAGITKPGGFFVAGFEDMQQLEQRNLDSDVFKIYSTEEAKNLFVEAGFSSGVTIESRTKGKLVFHCVAARK